MNEIFYELNTFFSWLPKLGNFTPEISNEITT